MLVRDDGFRAEFLPPRVTVEMTASDNNDVECLGFGT